MIRLLLVDDQSLICQGLQAVLTQESDLQVVGSAENGQVALDLVATLQPDWHRGHAADRRAVPKHQSFSAEYV